MVVVADDDAILWCYSFWNGQHWDVWWALRTILCTKEISGSSPTGAMRPWCIRWIVFTATGSISVFLQLSGKIVTIAHHDVFVEETSLASRMGKDSSWTSSLLIVRLTWRLQRIFHKCLSNWKWLRLKAPWQQWTQQVQHIRRLFHLYAEGKKNWLKSHQTTDNEFF